MEEEARVVGKQEIKEGAGENREMKGSRDKTGPQANPPGCCLLRRVTGTRGEQGWPRGSSQQASRGSPRGADFPEGRGSHQRLERPRFVSELPLAAAAEGRGLDKVTS